MNQCPVLASALARLSVRVWVDAGNTQDNRSDYASFSSVIGKLRMR